MASGEKRCQKSGMANHSTPAPPNILFIFTDQQHARMMSCAGNPWVNTPALDRLAAEGVRFERAYCGNPVCTPSRFSLLTGRLPSAIGLRNNDYRHLPEPAPEILAHGMGHVFRRAGYRTLYGGKQHLPGMSAEDLGFEVFETDERAGLAASCAERLGQPMEEPFLMAASFINPHDICYMAIRDFAETPQERLILERGAEELACLEAALQGPDGGLVPVEACPPLPDNFEVQEDEPGAIARMQAERPFKEKARKHYGEAEWRRHRWAYARLTERVDAEIGRVLEALREGPHAGNTVVVFTSDHGDMDGAHRMEHKTAFYEESAGVPLIIRHPALMQPGRVDREHVVSNALDLLPTLCDFAGIERPEGLAGESLRPLVEGRQSGFRRPAIPLESELGQMVVYGEFKYARYFEGAHPEQLHDLEADPGETRNWIADPARAEVREALRRFHWEWFGLS